MATERFSRRYLNALTRTTHQGLGEVSERPAAGGFGRRYLAALLGIHLSRDMAAVSTAVPAGKVASPGGRWLRRSLQRLLGLTLMVVQVGGPAAAALWVVLGSSVELSDGILGVLGIAVLGVGAKVKSGAAAVIGASLVVLAIVVSI